MIDLMPNYYEEASQVKLVAGCDEVGRGCLAGPVVAAAVILPPNVYFSVLKDSKQLSPSQRRSLDAVIKSVALDWAIGVVSAEAVDRLNVLHASHVAMHQAINQLVLKPSLLLIDGPYFTPYVGIAHQCIIRGDQQIDSIAAASIIAKVYRDQYMQELASCVPGYHWEANKGYPSKAHRQAIQELGITKHHRKSFRPVSQHTHATLWEAI